MPSLHCKNAITSLQERYFTARMPSFHCKNGITLPQVKILKNATKTLQENIKNVLVSVVTITKKKKKNILKKY